MQAAPNGKIYVGQHKTTSNGFAFLSAINYPNAEGLACHFEEKAVVLNDPTSIFFK